jgi:uncharacterized protein DUF1905/bacteriocin resistance YdeI/OmpD-like protein
MVKFTTTILKFGANGDKTGWTYIEIPEKVSEQIKPGHRRSFRVKGKLDNHAISQVAVMPIKGGGFLLPINAEMRKGIGKRQGAKLVVQLAEDKKEIPLSADLLECLEDEPLAKKYWNSIPPSHRSYYSKWIESSKTVETKTKRIAQAIKALSQTKSYGEMLREQKASRESGAKYSR